MMVKFRTSEAQNLVTWWVRYIQPMTLSPWRRGHSWLQFTRPYPQDSRSLYHAHGNAHYAHMGTWPRCCAPTGQDGSNKLNLEWFGSSGCWVVASARFQGLYHAHRHACMGKWPRSCTSTGQDDSNALDLEWIGPVVTELQHLQSLGRTNGQTDEWMKGWRAFNSPPLFISEKGRGQQTQDLFL